MTPGKIILVTGGNRGIGFEICRQLATMGHKVILTARTPEKVQEAVVRLANTGLKVQGEVLDVSKTDSFKVFVQHIEAKYTHLDVLINNAGIFLKQNLQALTEQVLDETLKTNLYGAVFLSRELISLLHNSKGGRIVNVSSFLGAMSDMNRNYTAYRLSKAALNAFTLHLSVEYPLLKINACHPGHVQTDMGGVNAQRTVEKGAETPVWLAVHTEIPTGKFFFDKQVVGW
ncbi:SDR family oxidoreductase [uncultured Microscilla sp.]|uniref:SDR family oxidoreductase n=1 Tax=uncultured Microscilla sp. TaxID=432653 RepID=UPI002611DDEF|nr:SDR family oxidoreductase [uncultured Microscilla sp.]